IPHAATRGPAASNAGVCALPDAILDAPPQPAVQVLTLLRPVPRLRPYSEIHHRGAEPTTGPARLQNKPSDPGLANAHASGPGALIEPRFESTEPHHPASGCYGPLLLDGM